MTVKINGKAFDFDSDEKYPGGNLRVSFSNVVAGLIILNGALLIWGCITLDFHGIMYGFIKLLGLGWAGL